MTLAPSNPAPGAAPEPKPFVPGTTGWTAADLDDPSVEREWFRGRYEIVEGVLTTMPAAYFAGVEAAINLVSIVKTHLRPLGIRGGFAGEVDVIVDEARVARADFVYLDSDAKRRQRQAVAAAGRPDERRTRILVPPTLIIESVSPGHEAHDHRTKRRWYAEFGVPNYWLLDAYQQTLECLVLEPAGQYRVDQSGRGADQVRPSLFPGLVIPLAEVWED